MTEQPRVGRTAGIFTKLGEGAPWFGSFSDDPSSSDTSELRSGLQGSLKGLLNSGTLAAAFVVVSAVYCFGVGRDRYQATSEFVIKQPLPPATASTTVLGSMQSSSVLSSLEDGRYLQVYLKSNAVKQAVFPDPSAFKSTYAPQAPDQWSGLRRDANEQEQLALQHWISGRPADSDRPPETRVRWSSASNPGLWWKQSQGVEAA